MLNKVLLPIFFFFSISVAYAEREYVFRHLDVVNGISDNQIRNITLTPDGRIAVRTFSILNIYNGTTFEHYYHDRRKDYQWNYNRFLKERYAFKEYYDNKGRLWMKAPDYLSLFDLNTNLFIYDIEGELKTMGINRKLKNLFIDDDKNYWFLTEDNTFSVYDITKKELKLIDTGNNEFTRQYGIPYEMAQYKNLYWILYSSGLLRCWDSASGEFIMQDTHFTAEITDASNFLAIHPTATGDLWLMYNNAVSFYNRTDKTWKKIAGIEGLSNFFTCMDLDTDGNVWVGTSWSGLRRIDCHTHEVEKMAGLRLDTGGELNNDIQCVFVDNNSGLWVGTLWQGICYYHPSMKKFKLVQTKQEKTLITNESIRCFLEDEDGTILIGTLYDGVLRYDPATGRISPAFRNFLNEGLCLSLYRDSKKRLWVGTFLNGFYCIDGKKVKMYNHSVLSDYDFTNRNISRAIYEDTDGRFWVSVSNQGVGELNIQTGKIDMLRDRHPEISFHKKNFGFFTVDAHTFAVYGESGIYYYNTLEDKIFIPSTDIPDFTISNIICNYIMEDSRALRWFGTERGIWIWDKENQRNYTIDAKDGLLNNSVVAIQEDDNKVMWAASAHGLTRVEVEKSGDLYQFSLVNFDTHEGLQNGKFFEGSLLKTRNGDLYFGGYNGFNTFNPNKIQYNQSKSRPLFTTFKLFNAPIKEGIDYGGHIILKKTVNHTKEIKLNYKQNFISFEFSGLNYVNPSHTYYKYKLENYDYDWTEIATSGLGAASYTGLPPGKYNMIVYTANNDKVWGDETAQITIIITPPFWATVYACIIYILLTLAVIYVLLRYVQKRKRQKQVEREALERVKQKEALDQMKFRFFTNISHEFRTPLTLIMTPLDRLIQQQQEGSLKDKLRIIYRNAHNMLDLINQLLDFRKLEMGGEKLKLSYNDFIKFVEYIHATFKDTAINRNMDWVLESECTKLLMWFDKNKMQKTLNNLYSNALKFTPAGGYVSTTIKLTEKDEREYITIEISDTGCGIDEKDMDSIFERFYQSETNASGSAGSGIGLHLVKEYVSLHEGNIHVNSIINEGTTFILSIPVDLKGKPDMENAVSMVEQENEELGKRQDKKTLLVVEDNLEFRHFLVEQLSEKFNTLEAGNGEQGEKIALQQSPDLIVSDLMMPEVDGLEMCERLKNNIQTSHIPIILLTARLSDEAKIESYKAGADSYISKPFDFEVLLVRIEMLIEQQEKRRELFRKTIQIAPKSITITSLDENFVTQALESVEKNIQNPDYSVVELCKDLGMSKSRLFPKFQSIIGSTPNNFIHSIRLKRAAQFLKSSQYNISEISDLVGFNSIKYFNKYFKEEFGMTPTQYRMENMDK
jgi:signal transduction histidine kinase/DNA-binding response OmpR family regulator/ligand-binding sensor domain-containing protein